MAYSSDLVRTKNWGTETLTDSDLEGQLDLIINWIMAAMDNSTGHNHDASNEGDQIPTAGIEDDAIDKDKLGIITTKGDVLSYSTEPARLGVGANDTVLVADSGETTGLKWATAPVSVQVVNTQTGAVATGTTTMPLDDTIPQNTEGDEYITLAVTPTSETNKLKIEVTCSYSLSNANLVGIALFQDTTANAVAAVIDRVSVNNDPIVTTFTHYMVANTISTTTFKVRIGVNAASSGTVTFNGFGGARKLGGVMASSITITEIKV